MLRVAALSSYENRAISSGVLILEGEDDPVRPRHLRTEQAYKYSQALTGIKSFYRLCDGMETLFLVNRGGVVLDIIEIARYVKPVALEVPGATAYRPHALATSGNRNLSIVLSPSHEIKVFADGVQTFSFRNARWHLIDLEAKYQMWVSAIGNPALAERLFQTALDLADSREGALFVVLRDAAGLSQLVAPADQLDARAPHRRGRANPRPAHAHAARPERPRARPGGPRRPGPHRRRHGHGSHRPAAGGRGHPPAH